MCAPPPLSVSNRTDGAIRGIACEQILSWKKQKDLDICTFSPSINIENCCRTNDWRCQLCANSIFSWTNGRRTRINCAMHFVFLLNRLLFFFKLKYLHCSPWLREGERTVNTSGSHHVATVLLLNKQWNRKGNKGIEELSSRQLRNIFNWIFSLFFLHIKINLTFSAGERTTGSECAHRLNTK